MSNALDQAQSLPPQDATGKGKVGDSTPPNRVGVKIKAAIFFDGTGNNENNTKKRARNPSYMAGWTPIPGARDSYANAYTNVALLHFMHQKESGDDKIVSVYVEGIGTVNDGDDDISGKGFGSGPTGIVDRVTEGIRRLASNVNTLLAAQEDGYLQELNIYTFGFSRGAAAARHFCARRTDSQGRTNNLWQELGNGVSVDQAVVKLKFVGLFETVSSFDQNDHNDTGLGSLLGKAARHWAFNDYSFRNDVPELQLRLEDPTLEKVVQLRAADEFRVNFSLTTIESATSQQKGLELILPGAHSDIGGSYQPGAAETRIYPGSPPARLANHFRQQGYYLPAQLVPSIKNRGRSDQERIITGTRRPGNSYQHVSLAVMLRLIVAAECEVIFSSPTAPDERSAVYRVPAGRLSTLRDQLAGFAAQQFAARPAEAVTAPVTEADYHWLRQNYLHLSWSDETGMDMRIDTSAYDAAMEAYSNRQLAARSSPATDSSGTTATPLPTEAPPVYDSYLPTRYIIHA